MELSYRGTSRDGPARGSGPGGAAADDVPASCRRRVVTDGIGIAFSVAAFAWSTGWPLARLASRFIEALAMSAIVFAGAAQFAALGLLAQGVPWLASSC